MSNDWDELAEVRAEVRDGKRPAAVRQHGHTASGYDMHPAAAAQHLAAEHGRADLVTSEAIDLNVEHRLLHGGGVEAPRQIMAADRALEQARLYLEDAGPEGPVKLREAVGRLQQPLPEILPVGRDEEWALQNRRDLALGHAVRLAEQRPDLVQTPAGMTGTERAIEAAKQIAAMAKVFLTMLDGG